MRKTHKNHNYSLREISYSNFWMKINAHAFKKAILRDYMHYTMDTVVCCLRVESFQLYAIIHPPRRDLKRTIDL